MRKREKVLLYLIKNLFSNIFALELRLQLMKKEQLLSQTKRELDTMEEYKVS